MCELPFGGTRNRSHQIQRQRFLSQGVFLQSGGFDCDIPPLTFVRLFDLIEYGRPETSLGIPGLRRSLHAIMV